MLVYGKLVKLNFSRYFMKHFRACFTAEGRPTNTTKQCRQAGRQAEYKLDSA